VLDDRWQVDLGDVAVPVDRARVEVELDLVLGSLAVPQGDQPVEAVDRLALGVGAVELDVRERPLDAAPPGPIALTTASSVGTYGTSRFGGRNVIPGEQSAACGAQRQG